MKGIIQYLGLKAIARRLALVDHHVFATLATRLGPAGLSDLVALRKQTDAQRDANNPTPMAEVLRRDVESSRMALARKWAIDYGVDPNFAETLMFSVISESCRVQFDRMTRGQREVGLDEKDSPEKIWLFNRQELLRLTEVVAAVYDRSYEGSYFGTKSYVEFERDKIRQTAKSLSGKGMLAELGCATAPISYELEGHFKSVYACDLSPHMVAAAEFKFALKPALTNHVQLEVADLEEGISLEDKSVSLAVINLGTASDIRDLDRLLSELHRVLTSDGKFVLSFYNADSLLSTFEFLPWPAPVAALVDKKRHILEVHFNGETYFLHARPYTVADIKQKLSEHGLIADEKGLFTHPTVSAIVPQDLLSVQEFGEYDQSAFPKEGSKPISHALTVSVVESQNDALQNMLRDIDMKLAHTNYHFGAYILVVGHRRN